MVSVDVKHHVYLPLRAETYPCQLLLGDRFLSQLAPEEEEKEQQKTWLDYKTKKKKPFHLDPKREAAYQEASRGHKGHIRLISSWQ